MTTSQIRRSFAAITIATIAAAAAVASGGAANAQFAPFPGEPNAQAGQHSTVYASQRIPRCFRVMWPNAYGQDESVYCERR